MDKPMHEEQLFKMVNEAVQFAQKELEEKQSLKPFAMLLYKNGFIESIATDADAHEEQYDDLVERLRVMVKDAPKITGIAIVAAVSIPAHYKAPVESGIRIHLEEKHKSDNKVGGRFLYVPYQLYKQANSDIIHTQLHSPIPVGIPQEIFVKE